MRVTRLDLVGFKSFADKTRLDYNSGVTAVVGPNGCGKSNIADAIRWVFGEQRVKALRGGSMEDVIFAGTDRRHPLGMAEVSLTVDNQDGLLHTPFTEVQVTRRRYRSGESEYLINQAPCRRLDVIQLFQDTGMGLDAFSYIEQGRIDMVLSSKPEDRRMIFEDAAGIVRYRKRQAEALRKLDRTDQNLGRLADTLQEIQRRCRSLKRQAAAAQRYRTLQEELRSQELRLARHQYDRAGDQLRTRTDALRDATEALSAVGARVSSSEAAIEQARLRQLELDGTLSHAQQDVYRIESEIDRAEAHIRVLEEKRRAAEERGAAAGVELGVLDARVADLAAQAQQVLFDVENDKITVAVATDAVREIEQALGQLAGRLTEAERTLERERQASLSVLNEKIAAENRRGTIVGQIELAGGRLARVADRIRQAERDVAVQARRLAESRTRVARLRREREATRTALATAESERANSFAHRAGAESELAGLREALSAARSKLRSLEQLRDQFEGFQVGVKTVLEAKRDAAPWTEGVRGVLADLLQIERRYEVALEAALGPYVQSLVTESGAVADGLIERLRASGSGRVTCLPLADFRAAAVAEAPETLPDRPGVCGWAANLIDADASLRPVLRHVLARVVVVESLAVAQELASQAPALGCVTLDGTVIEATGVRSGGAVSNGAGLIGRHNEIAELTRETANLENQVTARAGRVAELESELARLEARVAELAQHAARLDVDIRGLEQDCHRSLEALDTARQQAGNVRQETRTILDERAELLRQRDRVAGDLERLSALESHVQTRLVEAEHTLSALLGEKDALNEQLTARQVDRSTAEYELAARRREAERIANLREETTERCVTRRAEVEEAAATCSSVDAEIATVREQIQQANLQRESAQRRVTELQQERGGLTHDIGERERVLRVARQEQQTLTEEAHRLDVEVARLQDRLAALREQILTAYQVDLAAAAGLPSVPAAPLDQAADGEAGVQEEMWDPETAVEIVADLKRRLERMGPVNLIAIEEYEEYSARAEYLEQQDTDLKAARATLLNVIREIGATIEQRFVDTFAQVQGHFHEIFRVLFEGGRGRISLLDPEHPLESGIEIDVQPPGKHTQSISLLSGGERALTAAALLFAVFRTRPSPFCILDEIDAPLDDTNVLRLCRLIEKFSETTQFIVITHNKRTMELADTLYGVTMEERGVSQVVSVRLTREPQAAGGALAQVGVAAA